MVNKQQKKSTGFGFGGSCKSGLAEAVKGSCSGATSISALTGVHGSVLDLRELQATLPPPRPCVLRPLPIMYFYVYKWMILL